MLAIVTGTADGMPVHGEQFTPEDHARFISELVESSTKLDLTVKLIREDRPEQEYKLRKMGGKP